MTDHSTPGPTDQNTADGAPAPNLMVLKGIVIGLGVLLVLGSLLVAIKISSGLGDVEDAPAPSGLTLADMAPVPLAPGEWITTVSADAGYLFVHLEGTTGPGRILGVKLEDGATWQELPVSMSNP